MIRFKVLPIDGSDYKAVEEVLASKSLSMGKKVSELEEEFASYVGAKYAVAVNSCTSALYLALEFFKHRYRAVTIPSMTVPLVANAVIHSGCTLKFSDRVDWVGKSYELQDTPIIDSAHEVLPRTGFDKVICYSFYPTKPVCSAEGGMICTNRADVVDWVKRARWYGRDTGESKIKNSWEYTITFPGWKMNMTDIQAAIALNQLRKLPKLDVERAHVCHLYNEFLGEKNTSFYLYRINVPRRNNFIRWMRENGVECGVHFAPLHQMEAYSKYEHGKMKKTEKEYQSTVSLPFHDSLEDWEVKQVCDLVSEWRDGHEHIRFTPGA